MKVLHDNTEVSDDTPTKLVNGKRYLLTDDERAERETFAVGIAADAPFKAWKAEIAAYDQWVDRQLEETVDAIGKENFSEFIQEKYDEKKAVRLAQPQVQT